MGIKLSALSVVVLLAVAVSFAQPAPGRSATPGDNTAEAIATQTAELDKQEARLQIEERRLALERKERELAFQRATLDVQFKQQMSGLNKVPLTQWKARLAHLFPLLILAKLFALCAFACILINILLTIAVFNDMRARKEMNGLWIALVLIGGVCTALIYALLRNAGGSKSA